MMKNMKTYPEIAEERSINAIKESRVSTDCLDENFTIDFFYPRCEGNVKTITVGLSDVRAADSIRIRYDFDRDGYAIEQPYYTAKKMDGYIQQETNWKETAFLQAWALDDLSDEDFKI